MWEGGGHIGLPSGFFMDYYVGCVVFDWTIGLIGMFVPLGGHIGDYQCYSGGLFFLYCNSVHTRLILFNITIDFTILEKNVSLHSISLVKKPKVSLKFEKNKINLFLLILFS